METYVTVSFWMGVFALVINLLCILCVDYPKTKQETLGMKLFQVLVGGGFVVWAGFLIY
ncbi:hypothetical protein HHKILHMN_00021 [Vibrio phage vB_VpaS_PGA]|nr:hypothetical protein HHKILHMN_00021 [Vibrio phage vB_VpaS_PGA]